MTYHMKVGSILESRVTIGYIASASNGGSLRYTSNVTKGLLEVMADASTPDPTESPSDPDPERERPQIAQQIEDALREGSKQIRFDSIEKRFRGKRVWVLDREKMQAGVMRVVDQAIFKSQQEAEGALKTRQRVATAITNLFGNKRNLTSPVDPGQVPGQPATTSATEPKADHHSLEQQIARLASLINRAERVFAVTSSSGGPAGLSPGRRLHHNVLARRDPRQDKVLIKIFEDNLDLIRGMNEQSPSS